MIWPLLWIIKSPKHWKVKCHDVCNLLSKGSRKEKKCFALFCFLIPWVHRISWCTGDLTARWLPSVSMCLLYSPRHTLSSPALQTRDSIVQLSVLFWWDFCFDNWFSFWLLVSPFSWFCQFLNFLNLKCNLSVYICGKIGNSIYPEIQRGKQKKVGLLHFMDPLLKTTTFHSLASILSDNFSIHIQRQVHFYF